MSQFLVHLTDGEDDQWYDVVDYDDLSEMMDDFIQHETSIEDLDEDGIWICGFDDEFYQDWEYDGFQDYINYPDNETKLGQGFILDYDNLKSDVEELTFAEDKDVLEPVLIYLANSSCGGLDTAVDHVYRQGCYCGHFRDGGSEYAEQFYSDIWWWMGQLP